MLAKDIRPQMLFLYMLQAIYEAAVSRDSRVRIFFADFNKVFDLIDHNILIAELAKLDVSEVFLRWISAFLSGRRQAVRVEETLSNWTVLRGGIPQGSKLDTVPFVIMTNSLLAD